MGRELKRVPLDFNYPINKIWEGYLPPLNKLQKIEKLVEKVPEVLEYTGNICADCKKKFHCCDEDARYCIWYNKELKQLWYYDVPKGEGYQLWENTTEGSPQSPVFRTLDELCQWCADNATTFGDFQATKEEWMKMLDDGLISHTEGNRMFI